MKIGVLSDTHDRLDSLKQVIEIFKKNDIKTVVHCGDWVSPFTLEYFDLISKDFQVPIHSVFGNNEGDIKRIIERNTELKNPIHFTSKQTLELLFDNKKIIVYHGQDKIITNAIVKSQLYDAFFTGHTHKEKNVMEGRTLILNPGSTSFYARSGIVDTASVAIYDSVLNSAQIVYLKM